MVGVGGILSPARKELNRQPDCCESIKNDLLLHLLFQYVWRPVAPDRTSFCLWGLFEIQMCRPGAFG